MRGSRLAVLSFAGPGAGVMFAGPLAMAMATATVGCVNPQQDYDDYTNRTSNDHAPPAMTAFDAGSDVALVAPDAGFGPTQYFMSCLPGLAAGNTSEVINYVASVQFTPSDAGPGGSLSFSNQALVVGATSLSNTVGMSYKATNNPIPIAADGSGTGNFGASVIPGAANPINGQDTDFSTSTLAFHVESATQVCANLAGQATVSGVPMSLTGTCAFTPLPNGKPLPTYQLSDYHCP